jgi:hypothetical protein
MIYCQVAVQFNAFSDFHRSFFVPILRACHKKFQIKDFEKSIDLWYKSAVEIRVETNQNNALLHSHYFREASKMAMIAALLLLFVDLNAASSYHGL